MRTNAAVLIDDLRSARARTLALVQDLQGQQWFGPELDIVNPPLWEIGHVAWFHEQWILRTALGRPPLRADGDAIYNSAVIDHWDRWAVHLPDLDATLAYMQRTHADTLARVAGGPLDEQLAYFVRLATFHEDMHGEALLYTRQTLGYPAPRLERAVIDAPCAGPLTGDVEIPGGTFQLGAVATAPFVFDNEKWAHPVVIAPFRLARAPVTEAEFAEFVDDDGYRRRDLWCDAGWQWRTDAAATGPVYWQRDGAGRWSVREFDRWRPLAPHRPVVHVNWFEAAAFCRWAGRRLPTEVEWELAAAGACPALAVHKRRHPWGDEPSPLHAHLDATSLHCADTAAFAAGDSPFGCRQMLGNVWEWTASTFGPYPGFCADAYREYSEPWFGTRKVLRGGCFATPARLSWNTWRNFFTPDRRDVFAGFRTAATD